MSDEQQQPKQEEQEPIPSVVVNFRNGQPFVAINGCHIPTVRQISVADNGVVSITFVADVVMTVQQR